MKKILITLTLCSTVFLTACTTNQHGQVHSAGCDTGTNYGGAALGAVGGALVGSLIGGGSGNTIATVGGAALGGVAGSQTKIGCPTYKR